MYVAVFVASCEICLDYPACNCVCMYSTIAPISLFYPLLLEQMNEVVDAMYVASDVLSDM